MRQGFGCVVICAIYIRVFLEKLRREVRSDQQRIRGRLTLVRTLYSQLSTFSGTPAMLQVVEVEDGGEAPSSTLSTPHHLGNIPPPSPPGLSLHQGVEDGLCEWQIDNYV
jgi:hypothetical protein